MPQQLYIFDFDGTLTHRDTMIEFFRYAKGDAAFAFGLLLHAPQLVLMKLGFYSNGKAKQQLFTYFFKGMRTEHFNNLCSRFAHEHRDRLFRTQAVTTIRQALESGAGVMVVSASIENWVKPFFAHFVDDASSSGKVAPIQILATQIDSQKGVVTGRLLTPNCYGAEKVRRVEEVIGSTRDRYHIIAFGDSRGDKELLAYADERHYKPFR